MLRPPLQNPLTFAATQAHVWSMAGPRRSSESRERAERALHWKLFRKNHFLTQRAMADAMGISRRCVQKIEGAHITPQAATLRLFRNFEHKLELERLREESKLLELQREQAQAAKARERGATLRPAILASTRRRYRLNRLFDPANMPIQAKG